MQRRDFLGGLASAASAAAAWPSIARSDSTAASMPFAPRPPLARVQARPDRIVSISVCLRPFRPQGPRLALQRLHGKAVVHSYGHGGSGWSLSWGAAQAALPLVQATGARRLAVIGAGPIGLTTALVAQRAGLRVRLYASELPPDNAAMGATGAWSPDSRLIRADQLAPAFEAQWAAMSRHAFRRFQAMLGLPGAPVEWREGYAVGDGASGGSPYPEGEPEYAELMRLVPDLRQRSQVLSPHEHPFPVAYARRYTQLTFNLHAYAQWLMDEFLRWGGEVRQRRFEHRRQLAGLPEPTLVNATGYGARALFGDDTLVPVRGQTARLVPQPEIDYGVTYLGRNVTMLPRRDGLLVQAQAEGDYGNESLVPDRAASEAAVLRLAELFKA